MRDRETVIKALEHCSRRLGCNTCPYDHGCGRQSLLLEDAAKLLKEQEPVKPIRQEGFSSVKCGKCNSTIPLYCIYCPFCGRKVDWNA